MFPLSQIAPLIPEGKMIELVSRTNRSMFIGTAVRVIPDYYFKKLVKSVTQLEDKIIIKLDIE